MPAPYRLNHPTLLQANFQHPEVGGLVLAGHRKHLSAATLAACWTEGSEQLEIIADARNGYCLRTTDIDNSKPARQQLHELTDQQMLPTPVFEARPVNPSDERQGFESVVRIGTEWKTSGRAKRIKLAEHQAAGGMLKLLEKVLHQESEICQASLCKSFERLVGGCQAHLLEKNAGKSRGSVLYQQARNNLLAHFEREWEQTWLHR